MDVTFKQIVRHAGVFGLGAILFRLASIVLLPLYTHHLQPADYAVMAILDLTVSLLSVVAGGGIAGAATRAHFEADDGGHQDRVWWTALIVVAGIATVVVAPALLFRGGLSALAFGREAGNASYYFAIALPTMWISALIYVLETYFRAGKSSTLLVGISLFRLIVNVALNVTFLVGLGMGVAGILWGNLLSAALAALWLAGVFVRQRGPLAFDRTLARPFWSFGGPLVLYGLLSLLMHEADRYLLRVFVNLNEVGIYSVAYQIGQGINTLIITPFAAIWSVLVYEIARDRDAKEMYARVFKHFALGLALVMLGASLFVDPLLRLIAPPEYGPAARLVPIVCLAYLCFSLHEHFKVPALLANRTVALLPVVALATVVNISANVLLIPRFGTTGAAWASVLTFATFSGVGLLQYRRIDRYRYPFVRCSLALAGMALSYAAHRTLTSGSSSTSLHIVTALVIWIGWAFALFRGPGQQLLHELLARGATLAQRTRPNGRGLMNVVVPAKKGTPSD